MAKNAVLTMNAMLKFKANTDAITGTIKSLKGLTTNIGSTLLAITNLTKATDTYTNAQRVLNSTFGESTKEINAYIKQLNAMTGIANTDIADKISLFGQMARSMGLSTEQATDLSIAMADLSAKMAILYGKDFTLFSKAMLDAVKGESSTLSTMTGIIIKTETLQNTLDELGINLNASNLSSANKAMLEFITIARNINVTNDQLKTSVNDVVWQKKLFTNQVKELTRAIGNALYPTMRALLPVINAIVIVLTEIVGLVARLFGYKDETNETLSSQTQGWNALGDSIDETSAKMNKSLRGFDKLNNITTPTASSATAGGLGINDELLEEFNKANKLMQEIKTNAHEIADNILNWLGFTRDENGELQWTWKSVFRIVGLVIGVPALIGLIVIGVKKLVDKIKSVKNPAEKVSKFGEKIGSSIKAIGVGLAGLAMLGGLALVINSITELIRVISESGRETGDILLLLGGALTEVTVALVALSVVAKTLDLKSTLALGVMLGGIALVLHELSGLITAISESSVALDEIIVGLLGTLATLTLMMSGIVALAMVLSTNPMALLGVVAVTASLVLILYALKETLPTILDAVGDFIVKIAPSAIQMIDLICTHIETLVNLLGTILVNVVKEVGNLFEKIFGGIEGIIRTVGDVIVDVLTTIGDLIERISKTILDFVSGAGWAISSFVDGIIDAVTKLINFMISAIEYLVNNLILRAFNKVIDLINLLPGVNLQKKGMFQIERFKPQLRYDGGFVDTGEVFVARENGMNEFVGHIGRQTAVANNDQIIDGIAKGVMKANMATKQTQKVEIVAEGDDSGFLNYITFKQKERDRQYGF